MRDKIHFSDNIKGSNLYFLFKLTNYFGDELHVKLSIPKLYNSFPSYESRINTVDFTKSTNTNIHN